MGNPENDMHKGNKRYMLDVAVAAGDPSSTSQKLDFPPSKVMTVWEGITYLVRLYFRDKGHMPIFILVAQDKLAYRTVMDWADRAERHGVNKTKIAGAWNASEAFLVWTKENPAKLPD